MYKKICVRNAKVNAKNFCAHLVLAPPPPKPTPWIRPCRILLFFPYFNISFSISSRAAAAKLFSQQRIERWAFDVELIYLAERLNFSIAEVCVEWEEIDGSKLTPLLAGLQMGRDILLLWFRYTFGFWTISQN
ncbi:unnamed protein product [Meloidogyne enterolobii]|uniref:Uncharacterized protein n=1 Tax=Meloidogyne enterolobii TaxID=390850 RepID=A0ACB0XYI8_MELEN